MPIACYRAMNKSPARRRRSPLPHALFIAGCVLAGDACAEWFLVGRDENIRLYVDTQSIQRQGDSAQIIQITDFVAAQWADPQTAIWSIKALVDYDCRTPRSRALSLVAFSEQMAVGRAVASENSPDAQWSEIAPGTGLEKIRQIACGK
jgi:hypothetical protein